MTGNEAGALLEEFAEVGVAWDLLVGVDAKKANRIFDPLHALAKELRQTPAGRAGLLGLLGHDNVGVRLLAATGCLAWSSDAALSALESIEDSASLHAVSAKYTLRSYRAGAFNLDW